jgi:hypothetical protein
MKGSVDFTLKYFSIWIIWDKLTLSLLWTTKYLLQDTKKMIEGEGWVMVFNATFNNISVISWQSVLLVEETGENHWPVASHWQTLSRNVVSSTPHLGRIRTRNVSGDRHWMHRKLIIQLPYDHDGPKNDWSQLNLTSIIKCII